MGVLFDEYFPDRKLVMLGMDIDYKFDIVFDEDEEIKNFKIVFSGLMEDGLDRSQALTYLQRVVWALYKAGPPPLLELAAKKVLELELPQEELVKDVQEYLKSGPSP